MVCFSMLFFTVMAMVTVAVPALAQNLRGQGFGLLLSEQVWPFSALTTKNSATFTANFSGIKYIVGATLTDDRIWGADNDGVIWKLKWDGGMWIADLEWGTSGRNLNLAYDAEGITFGNDAGFAYFSTERIGKGSSRLTINQFLTANPSVAGSILTPTKEWLLSTAVTDVTVGSNAGFEAITFISNADLMNNGFKDSTGSFYNHALYPLQVIKVLFEHATLISAFVGLEEAYGKVYTNPNPNSNLSATLTLTLPLSNSNTNPKSNSNCPN